MVPSPPDLEKSRQECFGEFSQDAAHSEPRSAHQMKDNEKPHNRKNRKLYQTLQRRVIVKRVQFFPGIHLNIPRTLNNELSFETTVSSATLKRRYSD